MSQKRYTCQRLSLSLENNTRGLRRHRRQRGRRLAGYGQAEYGVAGAGASLTFPLFLGILAVLHRPQRKLFWFSDLEEEFDAEGSIAAGECVERVVENCLCGG